MKLDKRIYAYYYNDEIKKTLNTTRSPGISVEIPSNTVNEKSCVI